MITNKKNDTKELDGSDDLDSKIPACYINTNSSTIKYNINKFIINKIKEKVKLSEKTNISQSVTISSKSDINYTNTLSNTYKSNNSSTKMLKFYNKAKNTLATSNGHKSNFTYNKAIDEYRTNQDKEDESNCNSKLELDNLIHLDIHKDFLNNDLSNKHSVHFKTDKAINSLNSLNNYNNFNFNSSNNESFNAEMKANTNYNNVNNEDIDYKNSISWSDCSNKKSFLRNVKENRIYINNNDFNNLNNDNLITYPSTISLKKSSSINDKVQFTLEKKFVSESDYNNKNIDFNNEQKDEIKSVMNENTDSQRQQQFLSINKNDNETECKRYSQNSSNIIFSKKWSNIEDYTLFNLNRSKICNKWKIISDIIGTKTPNQCVYRLKQLTLKYNKDSSFRNAVDTYNLRKESQNILLKNYNVDVRNKKNNIVKNQQKCDTAEMNEKLTIENAELLPDSLVFNYYQQLKSNKSNDNQKKISHIKQLAHNLTNNNIIKNDNLDIVNNKSYPIKSYTTIINNNDVDIAQEPVDNSINNTFNDPYSADIKAPKECLKDYKENVINIIKQEGNVENKGSKLINSGILNSNRSVYNSNINDIRNTSNKIYLNQDIYNNKNFLSSNNHNNSSNINNNKNCIFYDTCRYNNVWDSKLNKENLNEKDDINKIFDNTTQEYNQHNHQFSNKLYSLSNDFDTNDYYLKFTEDESYLNINTSNHLINTFINNDHKDDFSMVSLLDLDVKYNLEKDKEKEVFRQEENCLNKDISNNNNDHVLSCNVKLNNECECNSVDRIQEAINNNYLYKNYNIKSYINDNYDLDLDQGLSCKINTTFNNINLDTDSNDLNNKTKRPLFTDLLQTPNISENQFLAHNKNNHIIVNNATNFNSNILSLNEEKEEVEKEEEIERTNIKNSNSNETIKSSNNYIEEEHVQFDISPIIINKHTTMKRNRRKLLFENNNQEISTKTNTDSIMLTDALKNQVFKNTERDEDSNEVNQQYVSHLSRNNILIKYKSNINKMNRQDPFVNNHKIDSLLNKTIQRAYNNPTINNNSFVPYKKKESFDTNLNKTNKTGFYLNERNLSNATVLSHMSNQTNNNLNMTESSSPTYFLNRKRSNPTTVTFNKSSIADRNRNNLIVNSDKTIKNEIDKINNLFNSESFKQLSFNQQAMVLNKVSLHLKKTDDDKEDKESALKRTIIQSKIVELLVKITRYQLFLNGGPLIQKE